MEKLKLIPYLLEKQDIYLPSPIFRDETIVKLEKALSSGKPIVVSRYYEEMANSLERFININKVKEMVGNLLSFSREFEHVGKLTEDDYKIINFMVENSFISAEDSIELSGPLYNLLKVYEELEKEKIKSDYVKTFIMISTYIQLYELVLLQLDRRLCNYIKNKGLAKEKMYKSFLSYERKYTGHATAGTINRVLSNLNVIERENDSILSGRLKNLRNKFSHANFFYDAELDVVFAGGVKLTKKEFIGEFYRLFNFALTWFKLSANADEHGESFDSFIKSLKNTLYELSKMFKMVERSHLRKVFGLLIIQWKKEIEMQYER